MPASLSSLLPVIFHDPSVPLLTWSLLNLCKNISRDLISPGVYPLLPICHTNVILGAYG